MKAAYVLSTPYPIENDNETLEQAYKRSKFENDNYICRGHILNSMSDALFDASQGVKSAKALWTALENKYMTKDVSSKNFFMSQFNDYKMVKEHYLLDPLQEIQCRLSNFKQHKMYIDEFIVFSSIINKLLPFGKSLKELSLQKSDFYQHG